jgi:hypothetical protein
MGRVGSSFRAVFDLIGFFANSQLGPDFLALMREAGKQMGGITLCGPSSSYGLAINGEGIGGRSQAASPDPLGLSLLSFSRAFVSQQ